MSLLKLFCAVDDFWKAFQPHWHRVTLERNGGRKVRATQLSPSEIMTVLIPFHQSHYRSFKAYYTEYVLMHRGWCISDRRSFAMATSSAGASPPAPAGPGSMSSSAAGVRGTGSRSPGAVQPGIQPAPKRYPA